VAGTGLSGFNDGAANVATFNYPKGVTIDQTGANLYVADTNNLRIRTINLATNTVSILAGTDAMGHIDATFGSPEGITIDSTGNSIYMTDSYLNQIRRIQ
jgi:DNA-binding beta-propeller fold protein YncE